MMTLFYHTICFIIAVIIFLDNVREGKGNDTTDHTIDHVGRIVVEKYDSSNQQQPPHRLPVQVAETVDVAIDGSTSRISSSSRSTSTIMDDTHVPMHDNNHSVVDNNNDNEENNDNYYEECGLFFAPSTIPGAGMGMYYGGFSGTSSSTKKVLQRGDTVTYGDAIVPIKDMYYHNGVDEFVNNEFLWDVYIWDGKDFSYMNNEPGSTIDAVSFGFGAIPNCLFPNLNIMDGKKQYLVRDMTAIDKNNSTTATMGYHPGSGAYTIYHDRTAIASKTIEPGDELFVSYGEDYFTERTSIYGYMPFIEHYSKADHLLQTFRTKIMMNHTNNERGNDKEQDKPPTYLIQALEKRWMNEQQQQQKQASSNNGTVRLEDFKNSFFSDLYELMKQLSSTWKSRTGGVLQSMSYNDMNQILDHYGSTKQMYKQRSQRSKEWLYQHGTCLDNIISKTSTIPYAGRGAYATRFLKAGSIVAPVPLIHIPNRTVLDMYADSHLIPMTYSKMYMHQYYTANRTKEKKVHDQLLLNYCFGHEETTLLLCPYGVVSSLINHGGTTTTTTTTGQSTSTSRVNTKIVWSTKSTQHPEWFNMSLQEWAFPAKHAGLAFDYVAIRDIQAGEEILIDYGYQWEQAWNSHVQHFLPKPYVSQILNENYESFVEQNAKNDHSRETTTTTTTTTVDIGNNYTNGVIIPTQHEWPWSNVQLWCLTQYLDYLAYYDDEEKDDDDEEEPLDEDKVDETVRNALHDARPCHIVSRTTKTRTVGGDDDISFPHSSMSYISIVVHRDFGYHDKSNNNQEQFIGYDITKVQCKETFQQIVFQLPRDAFVYGNAYDVNEQMYYSNEVWSFRHEIGIPDHLLPNPWKNNI